MGRRHRSHVFMPGKLVFPGGRTEPGDSRVPVAEPLHAAEEAKLIGSGHRASAARARAIAMSAIRETYEEAGLLIGLPGAFVTAKKDWQGFAEHGVRPALDTLRFVARAITPPGRVRRFDTRFLATWRENVAVELAGRRPDARTRRAGVAADRGGHRGRHPCHHPHDPRRTAEAARRRSRACAGRADPVLPDAAQPHAAGNSVSATRREWRRSIPSAVGETAGKVNWRAAAAAIASISVVGIAIGLGMPLLSIIMANRGYSPSAIGLNTAIGGIAAIVAAPMAVPVAARLGMVRTMLGAIAGAAARLPRLPLQPVLRGMGAVSLHPQRRTHHPVHPVRVLDHQFGAAAPARFPARALRDGAVARLRRRTVAVRDDRQSRLSSLRRGDRPRRAGRRAGRRGMARRARHPRPWAVGQGLLALHLDDPLGHGCGIRLRRSRDGRLRAVSDLWRADRLYGGDRPRCC